MMQNATVRLGGLEREFKAILSPDAFGAGNWGIREVGRDYEANASVVDVEVRVDVLDGAGDYPCCAWLAFDDWLDLGQPARLEMSK